jgi:hypothetical protein
MNDTLEHYNLETNSVELELKSLTGYLKMILTACLSRYLFISKKARRGGMRRAQNKGALEAPSVVFHTSKLNLNGQAEQLTSTVFLIPCRKQGYFGGI